MIIMKFGGTSVQDASAVRSVIDIVRTKLPRNPLVVVSAASGATNDLLETARLALGGKKESAVEKLNHLRNRHLLMAEELIKESRSLDEAEEFIHTTITRLLNLVEGISLIGELTNRSLDMFAAQGELMSSAIMAPAMREAGINCRWYDVRQVMRTDSNFGAASPDLDNLRMLCAKHLKPVASDHVVVTQGFIGSTADGITTTLGRGGSDYTAALLGAAMDAGDIEIWTDVDGVLTTDPRIIPNAKRVKQMTFREASELAYFGAKVLHPATIIPAVEKNIPVHVYNTKNPLFSGTLIAEHLTEVTASPCVIKSIAYKKGITVLNITSTRMLLAHGFMASIFDVFRKHQTSIDVVSTTEVSVSLTLDSTGNLEALVRDLNSFSQVQIESDRAIVCLVGEQMRNTPGIAARIFHAIPDVNIKMISQGASEINLTFVIDQNDVESTVRNLHHEFFSGELPEEVFE